MLLLTAIEEDSQLLVFILKDNWNLKKKCQTNIQINQKPSGWLEMENAIISSFPNIPSKSYDKDGPRASNYGVKVSTPNTPKSVIVEFTFANNLVDYFG